MTELTETERAELRTCPECDSDVSSHNDLGRTLHPLTCSMTVPEAREAAVAWLVGEREAAARADGARDMRTKIETLAERAAANARMMRARGREGKTPLHKMDGREGNTWDVIAHDLRALLADLGGEPQ